MPAQAVSPVGWGASEHLMQEVLPMVASQALLDTSGQLEGLSGAPCWENTCVDHEVSALRMGKRSMAQPVQQIGTLVVF